jgi:hypothetical protein
MLIPLCNSLSFDTVSMRYEYKRSFTEVLTNLNETV